METDADADADADADDGVFILCLFWLYNKRNINFDKKMMIFFIFFIFQKENDCQEFDWHPSLRRRR